MIIVRVGSGLDGWRKLWWVGLWEGVEKGAFAWCMTLATLPSFWHSWFWGEGGEGIGGQFISRYACGWMLWLGRALVWELVWGPRVVNLCKYTRRMVNRVKKCSSPEKVCRSQSQWWKWKGSEHRGTSSLLPGGWHDPTELWIVVHRVTEWAPASTTTTTSSSQPVQHIQRVTKAQV